MFSIQLTQVEGEFGYECVNDLDASEISEVLISPHLPVCWLVEIPWSRMPFGNTAGKHGKSRSGIQLWTLSHGLIRFAIYSAVGCSFLSSKTFFSIFAFMICLFSILCIPLTLDFKDNHWSYSTKFLSLCYLVHTYTGNSI